MQSLLKYTFILVILIITGCKEKETKHRKTVEIIRKDKQYTLLRNGKPYYIKGAGGYQQIPKIKEMGGNSIRTWNMENADSILNEAEKYGLTVTLGLDMVPERHGFNYDDKIAVNKQFEKIKKIVLKYKDHPALLMWGIGNELNVFSAKSQAKNLKVWNAVNDIAKMIHEVDPNHPTTTMIVPYRKAIWHIKRRCPDLDILSINAFGGVASIPSKIREPLIGWNKPYILSEWGPLGWWEVDYTIWDAPIEATTTKKAEFYKERYESSIKKDTDYCLGSYVFYWGQKQERTPTWFSMFSEEGEETEVVQLMEYIWTGKYSDNKAPKVSFMELNNKGAAESIFISSNTICNAIIHVSDPENDSLRISWEILPDVIESKGGGDKEKKPIKVNGLFIEENKNELKFYAPLTEGPYRVYAYVSDGHNHAATANVPFYIIE